MLFNAMCCLVTGVREYCSLETFKPVCGEHEVVLITSGRYGRMRFGRCMKEPHGSEGCSADVMPYLDRQCSGRRTCSVTLPDPALHTLHPCPRELVPYLEAGYRCVPGEYHPPPPALHALHPCPRELVPYLEAGYRCAPGECTRLDAGV